MYSILRDFRQQITTSILEGKVFKKKGIEIEQLAIRSIMEVS